jgi:hypothetical protein
MGHERMLNDRGRKLVRERLGGEGGPVNSIDHFRNLRQDQATAFDQEWDSMAQMLNFGAQNRLGYGDSASYAHFNNPQVPVRNRMIDLPRERDDDFRRNRTDIEPTLPGRAAIALP